jgi:hypothetical protein
MKTAEPGANAPEALIPAGVASLESILCTDELRRRPWRAPHYATENRALVALNNALDVVNGGSRSVLKKGGKLVTVASTSEGNVEQSVRDAFINGNKLTERKHYG